MSDSPTIVTSGLRTTLRAGPPRPVLQVDWIAWHSGFRGTALRVGDEIVAIEGRALASAMPVLEQARLPGQPQEASAWAVRGLKGGAPLRLNVRRRHVPGEGWLTLDVQGRLEVETRDRNAAGQATLGPGGPPRLQRDGFAESWAPWYDKRVFEWERQLAAGVWQRGGDSRAELARHLEAEPRVRHLAEHYPGPFAQSVNDDWQALHASLAGRRYQVAPAEYAYREAETGLVARVSAAARTAWDKLLALHAQDIVVAPGALDPVACDEQAFAGKLLVLPPVSADAWVTDVGRTFVSWRQNGGWVFTPLESPAADRMWQAQERYRRQVSPAIADEFSLLGRIVPQSRLISPKGRAAVSGLAVVPLAALVGRGDVLMCVDMGVDDGGRSPFAGEADVQVVPSALPAAHATPRQVLQALIDALYARDEQTWFALFADWHCSVVDGQVFYYPFYPYPDSRRGPDWTRSRRVVLDKTLALRIVWIDVPEILTEGDAASGLPRVERVRAELDHVGVFGAEHRAFVSSDVHRHWALQRRDGGPWRITSHQGI